LLGEGEGSEDEPKPKPKRRKGRDSQQGLTSSHSGSQSRYKAATEVVWVWGSMGTVSHLWTKADEYRGVQADCSGWVTKCSCPRYSSNKEPDGSTDNQCQECREET
jgi:hypothetical protein